MVRSKKGLCSIVVFLSVCFVIFMPSGSFAAQPESSYWFPEQLRKWSPESDPDAPFNRSTIPLADRETLYNVNSNAQSEAKLVALSALNKNTSGVPSQGGKEFFANTFSYWQYVDLMVYWAGSSGEGIIVPPSADVIDSSHKNGVPILGNVFFPPAVYGGKIEWLNQMLEQHADGSFPAADKLLEAAEYYGFDGWFINQETEGGSQETALKMKEFLMYLQKNKKDGMHIMWYDSMTEDGRINWQNALTDKNNAFLQDGNNRVSDSMFLNFWWKNQEASNLKAKEIGRSPYDLYTGIDVEAKGTLTKVPWNGIFPEGKSPNTSLGIYRPDWTFNSSKTMNEFYQKEQDFWSGQKGDPSSTDGNGDWKGMSHYFTDKTAITQLPFVTNFNTGSGQFFAVEGNRQSHKSWNNRSLQDILPTWRWLIEGTPISVQFDWNQAYTGGSSLKVSGELNGNESSHIKLYKTKLPVEKDTELSITYKSAKPNMKVGISFLDKPNHFEFFDVKKEAKGKWVTQKIKLKRFKGKEIAAISLKFDQQEAIDMNIGEIKVSNKKDDIKKVHQPENVMIKETEFQNGIYANVSLTWERNKQADYYEIYRVLPNGDKEWLGGTPNNYFYLSDLKREGKETKTELEVKSVYKGNQRSKSAEDVFDWPPYPMPKANFSSDKTLAAPGEEIQFMNQSSEVTEELEWRFEGGSPSSSTDAKPVVRYESEGTYSVTLVAKNSEGEDIVTKDAYITISKEANNVTNAALNKQAAADGQCASSEGPGFALDGSKSSKWCALGDAPHWLKVDLGKNYSLSKFVLHHAAAGGEPNAFNTKAFRIEGSTDGENWSEVVKVSDNAADVSEHSIQLTEARYVRLWIDQPTQGGDQAARIYEIEVFGYPAP